MPKYRGVPPHLIGNKKSKKKLCLKQKTKEYKQIRVIHYDLDDGWGEDINLKKIEKKMRQIDKEVIEGCGYIYGGTLCDLKNGFPTSLNLSKKNHILIDAAHFVEYAYENMRYSECTYSNLKYIKKNLDEYNYFYFGFENFFTKWTSKKQLKARVLEVMSGERFNKFESDKMLRLPSLKKRNESDILHIYTTASSYFPVRKDLVPFVKNWKKLLKVIIEIYENNNKT